MSRKRDKQRESRRELARQIDVEDADVPGDLLARGRVCEPEVAATLSLKAVRRGFLRRPGTAAAAVALYVVDSGGARLARLFLLSAPSAKAPAEIALRGGPVRGEEKVRYTRPGRFVAVAVVAEVADADAFRVAVDGLGDAERVHISVDDAGEARPVAAVSADRALETPRRCSVRLGEAVTPETSAGAVVVIPASHRVQRRVEMPLAAADGHLEARLLLDVRL